MNDEERWQQLARRVDPKFGTRNQQDVEDYQDAELGAVQAMEALCEADINNEITMEHIQSLLKSWLEIYLADLKMRGADTNHLPSQERKVVANLQKAQQLKTGIGREAAVEVFQQALRQIQQDDPKAPVATYIMEDGSSKPSLANSDNLTRSYIKSVTILKTTPL